MSRQLEDTVAAVWQPTVESGGPCSYTEINRIMFRGQIYLKQIMMHEE